MVSPGCASACSTAAFALAPERILVSPAADADVAAGFDEETVRRVLRLVDLNEYKRRQAPPGVKITRRNFGRDRRYPITNRFRDR